MINLNRAGLAHGSIIKLKHFSLLGLGCAEYDAYPSQQKGVELASSDVNVR